MADQTIRGKCQNLFGGPIAAHRAYTQRAAARKGIVCKKIVALSQGNPACWWNGMFFGKPATHIGSKPEGMVFRIMPLFRWIMIFSKNRIPFFRIVL
jgi:hypothetical protein